MRLPLQLLLAFLAVSTPVVPSDITTRDGTTYKHAQVTGFDADGLRITHSTGVTKVPFDNLPDALQKLYNYDPAKVAAYRRAAEEAKKAEAARAIAAQQEARRQADERDRQEREKLAAAQRQKTIEETISAVAWIIAIGFGLLLYFVPSIVGQHKANALAIFVLNLFLGWTFVGWVLALVWACTKDSVVEPPKSASDFREP